MSSRIRTDLNGLRVQLPGTSPIYIVDLGKKRHIPNPQVYDELFTDWKGIAQDVNIDGITTGDPIPDTAILFRCYDSPKIFLLDGNSPNYVKRHIASPAVMDHYNFNWNKVHVFNVQLNIIAIPDGAPIRNPPNAIPT